MPQNVSISDNSTVINHHFKKNAVSSQQETLGRIVVEILRDGMMLNRKSICTKLLSRMEKAADSAEENHYQQLIGMLFEK